MRSGVLFMAGLLVLAPQPVRDPLVPVGVWYGGPGVQPPEVAREPWNAADAWRRDLQAIRAAGFNSVTTWTNWAHAEPIRDRYRFDAFEQLLRLAEEAGLRVTLEVFPEPAPEWHTGPPCSPDSPIARMIVAASTRGLAHRAFNDLTSSAAPGADGCPVPAVLTPKPAGRPPLKPFEVGAALDLIRANTDPRGGWRVPRLQAAQEVLGAERGPEVTDADLRLWTWAALARGARGIAFDHWHRMIDETGAPTRAAQAAGSLAASLTRNAGLFASVAPRPPRVAILLAGTPISQTLYRAAFERNIPVDLLQPGDLLSGAASRYDVLLAEGDQPTVIQQALKAVVLTGGRVITSADGLRGLAPDIRIDAAPGLVEARFLESPDAWLLVAINHADTPQKVTMAFGPEIPEAIWVDMDTGNSVSFVQSKDGPTLTHTFPARDVLVLVRSKRLR
jgi:hypothetical protein